MAELSRRSFMVVVAGVAVGPAIMPMRDERDETPDWAPPPVRKLLGPPRKIPMSDGRFSLMWTEIVDGGGGKLMLWPAHTPEELADAQAFYETTRNYAQAADAAPVALPPPPTRSEQELALVEAILDRPKDWGLRLLYAEELTARNNPIGEFIRILAAMEGLPKKHPDMAALDKRWLQWMDRWCEHVWAPFKKIGVTTQEWGYKYWRIMYMEGGAITRVPVAAPNILPRQNELFRRYAPVAVELEVDSEAIDLALLGQASFLDQIHELEINDCMGEPGGFASFAASPHLQRIRKLKLPNRFGAEAAEALAEAPWARRLTSVEWSMPKLEPSDLAALLRADWPRLESLQLNCGALDFDPSPAFGEARGLGALKKLNLLSCRMEDPAGWEGWSRAAFLRTLETLELPYYRPQREALARFAGVPFRALRRLDLSGTASKLSTSMLETLLAAPWMRDLAELDLCFAFDRECDAGPLLAAAPLRLDHFKFWRMSDASFDAFLTAPWLPALKSLSLHPDEQGEGAIGRLIEASAWPNLRELELGVAPISVEDAEHLVAAPFAEKLTRLSGKAEGKALSILRKKYPPEVLQMGSSDEAPPQLSSSDPLTQLVERAMEALRGFFDRLLGRG